MKKYMVNWKKEKYAGGGIYEGNCTNDVFKQVLNMLFCSGKVGNCKIEIKLLK